MQISASAWKGNQNGHKVIVKLNPFAKFGNRVIQDGSDRCHQHCLYSGEEDQITGD
jgi:hypothetical protein